MRNIKFFSVCLFFLFFIFTSCQKDEPISTDRLIIGISADIKTLSPLYAFSVDEGSINDILFLSLVRINWNYVKGDLDVEPWLAESWEWSDDSSSLKFFIRDDIRWTDGIKVTAEDVAYSFDLYSNPQVQSKFYGTFEKLYVNEDFSIDMSKSIEVIDSFTIKINFVPDKNVKLVDVVLPIIPKHIFEKYEYGEVPTADVNFNPITCGPYKLKKWERNEMIVFEADRTSFLYSDEMIKELVFKIVPDYNSRITQLKKGEIDLVEQIKSMDVAGLVESENINIVPVKGREFDFVGWNHIDTKVFSETGEVKNNKFFSSANVRRGLSYAINRDEILNEYLNNFGQPAVTPVSPIFVEFFDDNLKPLEYNPVKAKEILKQEGWTDTNNNGTIDKKGIEFSFILYIPGGNPLRQFASTIIKDNLKAVGIDVKIETIELNKLIDNLFNKSMDAWIAAFYIQIPLEHKMVWSADLDAAPFNFMSYRNTDLDLIINTLGRKVSYEKEKDLHEQFQKIIYNDQPVTFLYWVDNIVAVNKKVNTHEINPLGAVQHLLDWRLN